MKRTYQISDDECSDFNNKQFNKKRKTKTNENPRKHNNVEYYIKGDELDTEDTKIIKSHNHIYFYSSITRSSAANLVKTLLTIDYENIEAMHKNNNNEINPIYLHILSEGGDIFAALAVYQNIRSLQSPVHGYINGFLSSAAIIILLACDNRYMSRTGFLGIHAIKMSVWGKLHFLQQCNTSYKKVWESLEKLYDNHTTLTHHKIDIKTFMSESQLLDAEIALKYGFVTELVD
jgi:ATP-dependent protease ClpP protease subunit